ncbi:MAG: Minf_1886 family protein [Candidatus Spyradosoma sp.]
MAQTIEEALEKIRLRDPRFANEAYLFVSDALGETVRRLGRRKAPAEKRHVSGRELAEGVADVALERFGPMTYQVFRAWGLAKTRDIGEIVYSLIDEKILAKSETDSIEDFDDVYDFRARLLAPWEAR